jgi:hypothetical protein
MRMPTFSPLNSRQSQVDLVWVVSSILQMVIPRLAFYVVSLIVVIVAIADTLYVIHLFSRYCRPANGTSRARCLNSKFTLVAIVSP